MMIFPGMDPYLEDPQIWPGLHASLIVYIRDNLQPQLRPRYLAAIEERVYVEGPDRHVIPDVWIKQHRPHLAQGTVALAEAEAPEWVTLPSLEIHEGYIRILDCQTGQEVVTVLEVVSPSNKFAGPGRVLYEMKQREVLHSRAHLVEIDLLREGPHVLAVPQHLARGRGPYHYLASLNRAVGLRTEFGIYRMDLRKRLPRIRIPLADADPDAVLDLQEVLNLAYEKGRYRDRIDYRHPCVPPLSPEDQAWANQLIEQAFS